MAKQQRWLEFLADSSIDVQYRPIKHNVLPDALFQKPSLPIDIHPCGDASLSSIVLEPSQLAKVYQGKQSDTTLCTFLKKAKSSDSEVVVRYVHGLSLLYQHPKTEIYQLVIPEDQGLHQLLVEEAHCIYLASHMGTRKVILALQ